MENIILQLWYAMAQTTCVWRHYVPQEETFCSGNDKVIEEQVIFPHQEPCPCPKATYGIKLLGWLL